MPSSRPTPSPMRGRLLAAALVLLPLAIVVALRKFTDATGSFRADRTADIAEIGRVTAAAIDAAGERALLGEIDGTIRLVDLATGASVATANDHVSDVYRIALHPSGRALSSGRDGVVHLWNLDPLHRLATLGIVRIQRWGLAFTPDGGEALLGGYQPNLDLWSVGGDDAPERLGQHQQYSFWLDVLAPSPRGRYVASISKAQPSVFLWSLPDLSYDRSFLAHKGGIRSLAWSPDGRLLATGGNSDGRVRLWEVRGRGERIAGIAAEATLGDFEGAVELLAFDAETSVVAAADEHDLVRAWSLVGSAGRPEEIAMRFGSEQPVQGLASRELSNRRPRALRIDAEARVVVVTADGRIERWEPHGADRSAPPPSAPE